MPSQSVSLWALNGSCDPLLRAALLSPVHSCTDRLHSGWGNASRECFCDKSTSEHAPLNLYLVDPPTLFLYYSLRQTDVLSVCLSTDHTAHLPGGVTSGWVPVLLLFPLTVLSLSLSCSVSIMCLELSMGVSLVFVRLSCMLSLNWADISTVSQERVLAFSQMLS